MRCICSPIPGVAGTGRRRHSRGRDVQHDALIQIGMDDLPLGGVGPSGMGQYHGHEGFLTFSKAKPVMRKGRFNSMKITYSPYGSAIQKFLLKWLMR